MKNDQSEVSEEMETKYEDHNGCNGCDYWDEGNRSCTDDNVSREERVSEEKICWRNEECAKQDEELLANEGLT